MNKKQPSKWDRDRAADVAEIQRVAASLGKPPEGVDMITHLKSSKELESLQEAYSKKISERNNMLEKADKLQSITFVGPIWGKRQRSLKSLLKTKGMTQVELARRAKMDPLIVGRVLKNPDGSTLGTIRKLARALDVDIRHVV